MFSAATAPHSDAAGQDAFSGAPVECVQDGYGSFHSLELAEEVEAQSRVMVKYNKYIL